MIPIQRLARNYRQLRSFTSSQRLPSKHEKDNDNPDDKDFRKTDASSKLNDLLQLMIRKDEEKPKKETQIAQAIKYKRIKFEKEKPLGEKLAGAAKDVASSLGGDTEKTESELLKILLRRSDPATQQLEDLVKGMKVEKSADPVSRAQQVRDTLARQSRQQSYTPYPSMSGKSRSRKKPAVPVDILGVEPSSYFSGFQPKPPACELRTWQACVDRDLRLAVTHPPSNVYEQLIQWTDKGLIWKFPIDNEQGLDKEKKVPFEEHVFLEEHLEGWCPEKGPIRHFMELVCVGLSKNHWLTVEEKKQHIYWYRDYFADKKTIIAEIGAGNISVEAEQQKEISK